MKKLLLIVTTAIQIYGGPLLMSPIKRGAPAFLPTSIATLKAWYDSTDNATITQVAGLASQWNDKSGNGINATQSNALYKPTVTAGGINGLQTLVFPYSSSFALTNTGMTLDFGSNLTTFSVGMVLQPNVVPTAYIALMGSRSNNTGDITFMCDDAGDPTKISAWVSGVAASGASSANVIVNGVAVWVFCTYATPTLTCYQNNVQVLSTTTNLSSRFLPQLTSIGGGTQWRSYGGSVGDVVIYTSVLSSGDRGDLYTKFVQPKWATP